MYFFGIQGLDQLEALLWQVTDLARSRVIRLQLGIRRLVMASSQSGVGGHRERRRRHAELSTARLVRLVRRHGQIGLIGFADHGQIVDVVVRVSIGDQVHLITGRVVARVRLRRQRRGRRGSQALFGLEVVVVDMLNMLDVLGRVLDGLVNRFLRTRLNRYRRPCGRGGSSARRFLTRRLEITGKEKSTSLLT